MYPCLIAQYHIYISRIYVSRPAEPFTILMPKATTKKTASSSVVVTLLLFLIVVAIGATLVIMLVENPTTLPPTNRPVGPSLSPCLHQFAAVPASVASIPRTSHTDCTISVTNANDSGTGSLRAAIADANSRISEACTIKCASSFSGGEIVLVSALPPLMAAETTIDCADPLTARPRLGITGSAIPGANHSMPGGITVFASNVTIRGLCIDSISAVGNAGFYLFGSAVDIMGNYVGIKCDGHSTPAGPNNYFNIAGLGASNVRVGSPASRDRNVIGGSISESVVFLGYLNGVGAPFDMLPPVVNIAVAGNYLGTTADGTRQVPITGPHSHVLLVGGDVSHVTVGGPTKAHGNVITGSTLHDDIEWFGGRDIRVANNWFNTDASGRVFPSNHGVVIKLHSWSTINVTLNGATIEDNVITGSEHSGIRLFDAGGIGGVRNVVIRRNRIYGSRNNSGITLQGGSRNVVIEDNEIYGNRRDGVAFSARPEWHARGVANVVIRGNVIRNNGGAGVLLSDNVLTSAVNDASQNVVIVNNLIYANGGIPVDFTGAVFNRTKDADDEEFVYMVGDGQTPNNVARIGSADMANVAQTTPVIKNVERTGADDAIVHLDFASAPGANTYFIQVFSYAAGGPVLTTRPVLACNATAATNAAGTAHVRCVASTRDVARGATLVATASRVVSSTDADALLGVASVANDMAASASAEDSDDDGSAIMHESLRIIGDALAPFSQQIRDAMTGISAFSAAGVGRGVVVKSDAGHGDCLLYTSESSVPYVVFA